MSGSLQVLYEDNHLIAINKRPSDLVQGDKTGDEPLNEIVKNYIKTKFNKPGKVFLGTIHRIDRPVSGIVLFARTSKALERMNRMFQEKKIQKTYWAVVKNKPIPETDTLTHYLWKNEKQNKSYVVDASKKGALQSQLTYDLIAASENYYLLEIKPASGRHHQIRVQLARKGCPIKGDLKYGFARSNNDASIHLHARAVNFIHPVTGDKIQVVADPPQDPVWDYFLSTLKNM